MAEEAPEFVVGDIVYLQGGLRDNTKGKIYYMDADLLRIMPFGSSDRVVEVNLGGEDYDNIFLVEESQLPTFVEILGAKVGYVAEAYGVNGEPIGKYTIEEVNQDEDTLKLEGMTEPISFRDSEGFLTGIPLDLPFAVLRVREPPQVVAENEAAAAAAALAEQEDAAEKEDEFTFLGQITEEVQQLVRPPDTQVLYSKLQQQNSFLQEEIALLDLPLQRNPRYQKQIQKLVEQCTMLKDEIVQYNNVYEPLEGMKQTSVATLGELLEKRDVPLARPVINAERVLYVEERSTRPDRVTVVEKSLPMDLLQSTTPERDPLKNLRSANLNQIPGAQPPGALPRFYLAWDLLFKQFTQTFASEDFGTLTSFQGDKDFLRISDPDGKPAGFPSLKSVVIDPITGRSALNKAKKDRMPITSDLVVPLELAVQRAIGPRYARLQEKVPLRKVESGDEAGIVGQTLFPLETQRDLGINDSGKLAKNIAYSHTLKQTLAEILQRLGGIPEEATTGGIITVGENGNTDGNIGIDDWLRGQPLLTGGLGDMIVELKNLGLADLELRKEQQEALVEKIDEFRALIKNNITNIREESARALADLRLESNTFLQGEALDEMLDAMMSEPLIALRIAEVKARLPAYKDSDIALIAGTCVQMSDLFLSTMGGVPTTLARERNRRIRDNFLNSLQSALKKLEKKEMRGEFPVKNSCPHVADSIIIRKTKDADTKMQLLSRQIARFMKERKDNWLFCSACPYHLMCYHEALLLREYMYPREKEAIHKELLLAFSGGVFQGKYICKNCGQPISDLDFDQSLEYDDEGRPMMGRSVLVDKDAVAQENLEMIINGGVVEEKEKEELTLTSDLHKLVYATAREIFDKVGIYATNAGYKKLIERVEMDINRQPSREDYARLVKAKGATGALDYDILINRVLISSVGVHALIEIQTNIPGYIMRYKLPGCKAGFTGYPMGPESDRTGLEYIGCAIERIRKSEAPWSLAGYHREAEARRKESVLGGLKKALTDALKTASVQQLLLNKRAHLQKVFGSAVKTEGIAELLPESYKPVPYFISETEAAEKMVVADAASEEERVRAWIQMAHKLARTNGTYVSGSAYSEVSCCFRPIGSARAFWEQVQASLPTLPSLQPPQGPVGAHVGVHFKPRQQDVLSGEVPDAYLYKVFLKVCYDGPNKGLPHEPGYTNKCMHCGFLFPESPYVEKPVAPFSSDKKQGDAMFKEYMDEQQEAVLRGKAALDNQKIATDKATFESLLDIMHSKFHVDIPTVEPPIAGIVLLQRLLTIEPEPFAGWREVLSNTITAVSRLPPESDDISIAEAYGPISTKANEIFEELKARLGEKNGQLLKQIFEASPSDVAETVLSYFLVPLHRSHSRFDRSGLVAQYMHELGPGTAADIEKILQERLRYLQQLKLYAKGFTRVKLLWFIEQLRKVLPIIKQELRPSLLNGGKVGLPYLLMTLVGGILINFVNPNILPPTSFRETVDSEPTERAGPLGPEGEVPTGPPPAPKGAPGIPSTVDAAARAPLDMINICLENFEMEGLRYSEQEIRDLVAQYSEREKNRLTKKIGTMTPEERALDNIQRKRGLGEYAVGGTDVIRIYNPDQYERERLQRMDQGMEGLGYGDAQGATDQDRTEAAEGVDHIQTREDDF
jgi:hypothetical protein